MTISSDPTTESMLAGFRSSLDSVSAQAAMDALVKHAHGETGYRFVPHGQGALKQTVRYFFGDLWAYVLRIALN